jgi:hypothetical protein
MWLKCHRDCWRSRDLAAATGYPHDANLGNWQGFKDMGFWVEAREGFLNLKCGFDSRRDRKKSGSISACLAAFQNVFQREDERDWVRRAKNESILSSDFRLLSLDAKTCDKPAINGPSPG